MIAGIERVEVDSRAHHIGFLQRVSRLIVAIVALAVQSGVVHVNVGIRGGIFITHLNHIHGGIVGEVNINVAAFTALNIVAGHIGTGNG